MPKKILAIVGSATTNSANHRLMENLIVRTSRRFEYIKAPALKTVPPFDPHLIPDAVPEPVKLVRQQIRESDAVLISTPEYIFSIPSGLKNLFEWCVSTTVFQSKPVGLITASAQGEAGQRELERILQTLMARFTEQTSIRIPGISAKFDRDGLITDCETDRQLDTFLQAFESLVRESS